MTNIVILGAGVMGSALAVVAATHESNQVTLVGSPLDNEIIESINSKHWHPTLKVDMPAQIEALAESNLQADTIKTADIIVIGVSSPGIDWVVNKITQSRHTAQAIALVTKGLVASNTQSAPPLTYADALANDLNGNQLIGIGGPCIARELALGIPTFVTFASRDQVLAQIIRNTFQTNTYRIAIHPDIVGLEACAALKNFYCIGVSAMLGAWEIEGQPAKNPVAALFNQAVIEMNMLCSWLRAPTDTMASQNNRTSSSNVAFDLPGMGDLHVTVGGGRNSKLGTLLGRGQLLSDIVEGPMKDVTVEGLDTGRQLLPGFRSAVESGVLRQEKLPLTLAILDSIENNCLFSFDFTEFLFA